MKVRRSSVSNKIKEEIIDMTSEEVIELLQSGVSFIVDSGLDDTIDYEYELSIMNYDDYVE